MNTIKKLIAFILILISGISLASCGFVGSTGGRAIKSIETIVENGQTKLVITYEDETIEPDKFVLPSGKDGVGIQTIIVNDKYDGTGKDIIVELTDGRQPAKFEVSNGISVIGVTSELDAEDNTLVYVEYSDGTKSEPIKINKGNDGVGFTGFDKVEHPDGSQLITLKFGEKPVEILIPAGAPGPEGRGIQSIISDVVGNEYIFRITYTDGKTEDVKFPKPTEPSQWLTGQHPGSNDGKDGDFFFDKTAQKIYHKQNGLWNEIASLGIDKGICKVEFFLNSPSDSVAQMPEGVTTTVFSVKKYTYFTDLENQHSSIPVPSCPGYRFKGWYTDYGIDLNETSGKFTELTPVLSDLKLFAKWEKIN